jgi:hypothetical protein
MPQNKEPRQLSAQLEFVVQQNFHQELQQKVATLEFVLQQRQHGGFEFQF